MDDELEQLYASLDLASEALAAYQTGLVPDFSDMEEDAYVEWHELVTLGLLEINSNLLKWVAGLTGRDVPSVRSEVARAVASRSLIIEEHDDDD